MPEEVSPESKLYVKEEIEKTRKDIREEVDKVNSRATKTFTTVALVVGILTGLGVYGIAKSYINTAVEAKLGAETVKEINNYRDKANKLYYKIAEYEQEANAILASQSYKMLIGTIVPYGGEIVETTRGDPCQVRPGWFLCNGASLDREEYKDLFDVIGKAFGAPTPDTFNLPDLRGRVAVGAGSGKGLTQRTLGEKDGEETHKLTIDEMPRHRHKLLNVVIDKQDEYGFEGSEQNIYASAHRWFDNVEYVGNDKSHNNMQPFLVVNYIIKAR